ncbi:MAG: sigma 54-dependent Fis family transcriptional regulator [Deltaproteobacteria bacterium]|nr:sigma 54-dependent Fis family transcriptional regulator [Deltaproteobacteria bacterium]
MATETNSLRGSETAAVTCFQVQVLSGPDAGARTAAPETDRLALGTSSAAGLRLTDPTVSRIHCELRVHRDGVILRDLDSTNGTRVGSLLVREATLTDVTEVTLGGTTVRVSPGATTVPVTLRPRERFGPLLGSSEPMCRLYATLERVAKTNASVLLLGESGTGKELAARAIHAASPRARRPYEVLDCAALPLTLAESELFGHEKGAFTGADHARPGRFELADGGTLFLDEVGELPLELQPKLLRALEAREVRRMGASAYRRVDVRVLAATRRDLRSDVNRERFREDLYFRLAVIPVTMPPLRERLGDLELLVPALLEELARAQGVPTVPRVTRELLDALGRGHWPGNVRELRNALEHYLLLDTPPMSGSVGALGGPEDETWEEAQRRFERGWFERLLEGVGGSVSAAAKRAGINRSTLWRTLQRHGLRSSRE